jgi:hypothetical protein
MFQESDRNLAWSLLGNWFVPTPYICFPQIQRGLLSRVSQFLAGSCFARMGCWGSEHRHVARVAVVTAQAAASAPAWAGAGRGGCSLVFQGKQVPLTTMAMVMVGAADASTCPASELYF